MKVLVESKEMKYNIFCKYTLALQTWIFSRWKKKEETAHQTCTSWGSLSITASNLLSILGTWTHKKMFKAFLCQYNDRSTKRPVCHTWNGKYQEFKRESNGVQVSRTRKKKKKVQEMQQAHLGETSLFWSVVQVQLDCHFKEVARYYVLKWIVLESLVWYFLWLSYKKYLQNTDWKSSTLWKIVPEFHSSGCMHKNTCDYLNQRGPFFIEIIWFDANKPLILLLLNTANIFSF